MGCGGTRVDTTLLPKETKTDTSKSKCLIFGMPNSGQDAFIKSIESCFSNVGNQIESPFIFIEIETDRESRTGWVEQFSLHSHVIASFFFANVKTTSGVLMSVKTINWFRSQLLDQNPPQVVGYVQSPNELNNFSLLKEKLSPGIEASTFNNENASDIQKYIEFISSCAARHPLKRVPV